VGSETYTLKGVIYGLGILGRVKDILSDGILRTLTTISKVCCINMGQVECL